MASVTSTDTSPEIFDVWLSANHWSDSTLTFSFPSDGATYNYLSTGAVTPISESQKTAVRQVLESISSFTGLSFSEITEGAPDEAILRFATDATDDGAYAYLPREGEKGGDAFFGTNTDNPQPGNESFLYFQHEIGHTLGLDHGHEYASFRDSGFDSQEFTVLTYTDYIGDTDPDFDSGPIDWAQSFMQLDIAALQFLYGANYATSGEVWSGNTIYRFDPDTGEMSINGVGQGAPAGNRIFRTIWDGDGTDTYDLGAYTGDLVIDLSPGGWSVFAAAQLADLNRNDPDPGFAARGNVANARLVDGDTRALIENARGGSGNDRISGNDADNRLRGMDGNDRLSGGDGADILLGSTGDDDLFGDGGNDLLRGGAGQDRLFGGNRRDELRGGGGDDELRGQAGKDRLFGLAGDDVLIGGNGSDVLTGGYGRDRFVFRDPAHSGLGAASDIITDFTSGRDVIDLSRLSTGGFDLSLDGAYGGAGPWVITYVEGADTVVLADVDGDTSADFRLILENTTSVQASDFIL